MKKMICGILLTLIGLVYSASCFVCAVVRQPWSYNGIDGILGSLLGTQTMVPFIISLIIMVFGLVLCCIFAFKKDK